MDKDVLAVIGKLYLEILALNNHIENQNQRLTQLENMLKTNSSSDSPTA